MGITIGIDLGTTTSEIAYIKNGKPELIVDKSGNRIIPSVTGVNDYGNIVNGEAASNQIEAYPERTIAEVKRLIGRDEKIKLGDKVFLPHEISAELLKELKEYAEDHLGKEVTEAVITVPANFNNSQRKLTKQAGELAGLKVDRIINEPTAAAMAYGIDNLDKEEKVLVYDLGGGTFDVTILEMFDGILDVMSSRGNNLLGGKDFDERIEKYILDEFKKQYGVDLYETSDISIRHQIKSSIKNASINAKKELSTKNSTSINIPFIAVIDNKPITLSVGITRDKFNELTKDLVDATEKTIDEALNAAGYTENDIDVVLLVGGSSRIAAVQKLVHTRFPNKVKTGINPDEAVALGAAVQAGIKSDLISSEDSLIVTDKSSYSLGTSVSANMGGRIVDGLFDCLIPRDSSIPCSRKKSYVTMNDNQTEVNIDIYEGDAPVVWENTKIADFNLSGIPEGPAGTEGIEIEFNYDLNGILEVKATISSTGESITKIVDNFELEKSLDCEDIKSDQQSLGTDINLEIWKECSLAVNVKNTIDLAERKIDKLDNSEIEKLQIVINKLKKAVIDENEELVEIYDEELTDILFDM